MTHPAISVDGNRIRTFAEFLRQSGAARPFDFCSPSEGVIFPTRNQPGVLEYFFFCTAHQFGFWHLKHNRYDKPMTGRIDGVEYKGSDYLSRCATRAWLNRHDLFTPATLTGMTDADWSKVFSDDDGRNPLPMWSEHLAIIHGYTDWFGGRATTPADIVRSCNSCDRPLAAFLDRAGAIPGYREDRLHKKLMLLAAILENRPEHFLRVTDPEAYGPIVDYHIQRSVLRTGMVRIAPGELHEKLVRRERVEAGEERDIRDAAFEAITRLVKESGLSVAAVDYFLFLNRKRCPEMTDPDCAACPVDPICAHEKALFQPVFRTTDY